VTGARVQNCPGTLTQQQLTNFNSLSATLTQILGSETPCPGDGNLDKVVDQQDIKNWALFSQVQTTPSQSSSWYDFDFDGVTGASDLSKIQSNLGKRCVAKN
jgi:hypothetical protein